MSVEVVTSPLLEGTRHGFLGRIGGVSTGLVAGLNVGLGSSDDPAAIAENRRRAVAAVAPGAKLVTAFQYHSADVFIAGDDWPGDERPHGDGIVTNRPGLVLGILTADCAPILFADTKAGVIGAAHAGWKGAFGGVAEKTIDNMEYLGARRDRITAVVGPCIAQESYEVSDDFPVRFAPGDPDPTPFFAPGRPGHLQFDLPGWIVASLKQLQVGRVEWVGIDTLSTPDRFYSFRRATLAGEPDYGRQISLIALG